MDLVAILKRPEGKTLGFKRQLSSADDLRLPSGAKKPPERCELIVLLVIVALLAVITWIVRANKAELLGFLVRHPGYGLMHDWLKTKFASSRKSPIQPGACSSPLERRSQQCLTPRRGTVSHRQARATMS